MEGSKLLFMLTKRPMSFVFGLLRKKLHIILLIGLFYFPVFMWGINSPQIGFNSKTDEIFSLNRSIKTNLDFDDFEEEQIHVKRSGIKTVVNFHRSSVQLSTNYNQSSPIYINGNDQFITAAGLYNWTGDGSSGAPYIISGLNITKENEELIEIYHTDLHFQISNCLIQKGTRGIIFHNVTHGVINNTITTNNTELGVYIYKSRNCTVINLHSLFNGWAGVEISSSNYSILANINATNNHGGIAVKSVRKSIISNIYSCSVAGSGVYIYNAEECEFSNIITRNNYNRGISISNSNFTSIFDSTCINNSGGGVYISSSDNINISGITSINNTGDGIEITNSNNNHLTNFEIFNNSWYGLELDYSNRTFVKFGDIYNNIGGVSISYAQHCDISNLNILHNSGFNVNSMNNGSFTNINCAYLGFGFDGEHAENIFISNWTIFNHSGTGISLEYSKNSIIQNNIILNNSDRYGSNIYGIMARYSINCTILHNSLLRTGRGGIDIIDSNDTVISHNIIQKNRNFGIRLYSLSFRNTITNNIVYHNGLYAITGDLYTTASILNSDKNEISANDCIANSVDSSQADLQGPNFEVHHNYWDDIHPLDENGDGIVDKSYQVGEIPEWSEKLYDEYPLILPINPPKFHYLTSPILIYPKGWTPPELEEEIEIEWQETEINGTVTILWITPIDTEDHQIAYSIFYSRGWEENWTLIISGLENSYYDWDTTTVLDGRVRLKIEATCTHGEHTGNKDQELIRIDNSPPILTDLYSPQFSPIIYILFGMMIILIFRGHRMSK